jgi:anaerobic magnesium-protoporphyrin IX monomethyl ester cyclase
MKILVISVNRVTKPLPCIPLGAGMVFGSLKHHGYETYFLDLAFVEDPFGVLTSQLKQLKPEIICLSVRNIDNQFSPKSVFYLDFAKSIVRLCRELTTGKIIIGGAAMTVMPKEILQFLEGDYGISGHGEREIIRLVKDLETGQVSEGQRILAVDSFFDPVLSLLPNSKLFSHEYFKVNPQMKKRSMVYQTSRGCTGKCIYCKQQSHDRKVCHISPEQLREDMMRLQQDYHIGEVTIADDMFNYDLKHPSQFCEQLNKLKSKLKWTCCLTPGNVSEDMIFLMKISGCCFVDLGIDSASEIIIKRMKKGFEIPQLFYLCKLLSKYEIPYSISLLFGGPEESEKTIAETISNVNRLQPVYVLASMGIRLYPDTLLHQIAIMEGKTRSDENLLLPKFYLNDDCSEVKLKKALANSRHIYKDMRMNTIN